MQASKLVSLGCPKFTSASHPVCPMLPGCISSPARPGSSQSGNRHHTSCHRQDQIPQALVMALQCRTESATIPGSYRPLPESACHPPRGFAACSLQLTPVAQSEAGTEHPSIALSRWPHPYSLDRWHTLYPEATGVDRQADSGGQCCRIHRPRQSSLPQLCLCSTR